MKTKIPNPIHKRNFCGISLSKLFFLVTIILLSHRIKAQVPACPYPIVNSLNCPVVVTFTLFYSTGWCANTATIPPLTTINAGNLVSSACAGSFGCATCPPCSWAVKLWSIASIPLSPPVQVDALNQNASYACPAGCCPNLPQIWWFSGTCRIGN